MAVIIAGPLKLATSSSMAESLPTSRWNNWIKFRAEAVNVQTAKNSRSRNPNVWHRARR